MPTVTLAFDFPADMEACLDAQCGAKYYGLIKEIDEWAGRVMKYDTPIEEVRAILEDIRAQIRAGLQDIWKPA